VNVTITFSSAAWDGEAANPMPRLTSITAATSAARGRLSDLYRPATSISVMASPL
jgi:hypothetical protein